MTHIDWVIVHFWTRSDVLTESWYIYESVMSHNSSQHVFHMQPYFFCFSAGLTIGAQSRRSTFWNLLCASKVSGRETWLIHLCAITYMYVCHDLISWNLLCASKVSGIETWLIHLCAMTYIVVCHDLISWDLLCASKVSGRETWLIHLCAMTYVYVCQDLISWNLLYALKVQGGEDAWHGFEVAGLFPQKSHQL